MGKLDEMRALGRSQIGRMLEKQQATPLPERVERAKAVLDSVSKPVRHGKSNKVVVSLTPAAPSTANEGFDKKAYQREYMRKKRAEKQKKPCSG